jgi:hypothetical protein
MKVYKECVIASHSFSSSTIPPHPITSPPATSKPSNFSKWLSFSSEVSPIRWSNTLTCSPIADAPFSQMGMFVVAGRNAFESLVLIPFELLDAKNAFSLTRYASSFSLTRRHSQPRFHLQITTRIDKLCYGLDMNYVNPIECVYRLR